MRYYNNIPFWENVRRKLKLKKFKSLIDIYFKNSKYDWQVDGIIEGKKAREVREPINLRIIEINNIVKSTGISSTVVSYPAPAVGGHIKNINIFDNFFNLHSYSITFDHIFDILNRSIGILQTDLFKSIIRTINPLYWLILILDYIVSIPFQLIRKVGLDNSKFENSFIGKLFKVLLYIITVSAAIITILQAFNLWEVIMDFYNFPNKP